MKIGMVMVAAASLLLGGCASMVAEQQQAREEFQRTIPTCEGKEMCDALWEHAQLWVVQNAGMKIQTVTSVLIETYNSVGYSTDLAVQVVKEPIGNGNYRLVVTTRCANIFGCVPDARDSAMGFNWTINRAKAALTAAPAEEAMPAIDAPADE